jgi:hypothetical protein
MLSSSSQILIKYEVVVRFEPSIHVEDNTAGSLPSLIVYNLS